MYGVRRGTRGGGRSAEQQLALSRGPGEGAGEEVSIALLLHRPPDTDRREGGAQSPPDQRTKNRTTVNTLR